jgi:hypothetical protein
MAVEITLRHSLSVRTMSVKSQESPTGSGAPENGIPANWKRELSEWLLVVMTMGVALWVFFTLVQLVFDFATWLRGSIN